ncbi:MAG: MmcQ/YjbR family DNA-binding protein, partial [Paludibacter sp.]
EFRRVFRSPEKAIELREEFSCIVPAYHFNKKHWNSVIMSNEISEDKIKELINHSYDLVLAGLPRKEKLELNL